MSMERLMAISNVTGRQSLYIAIIVMSFFVKYAVGLYCYQCGITTDGSDSCNLPPKMASFVVECHSGDYCSKTVSHRWENDVDRQEETRGCAAPMTISGKRHELGCHVDQRSGAVVCYCDADYCNASPATAHSTVVFTVTPIIVTVVINCIIMHNWINFT